MIIDMPPLGLEDARHLYDRPAYVQSVEPISPSNAINSQKNEIAYVRKQAIFDTALGISVKAGMAWQLRNIDKAIKRHEREFDTIYNFSYLMIKDRVVPPVVTEVVDLYHQEGDYTLRLSGAYYKIEYQARFSSTAPNWREYLTFPKMDINHAISTITLKARNSEERVIWESAVTIGWKQGVEQANLILEYGLDRMNRDFIGMLRFHTFVMQGKLTMPAIASESIPVTYTKETMAVDETLLRITTLPEFNEEMKNWRGAIKSSAYISPVDPIADPVAPILEHKDNEVNNYPAPDL